MKLIRNHYNYYYNQNDDKFHVYNGLIHASIPECILQLPNKILSVYGRMIYLQVITQIVETGFCNKSNKTLSSELDISVRKVSSELKRCVKLKLLSVHYSNPSMKKGHRNFYLSSKNFSIIFSINKKFLKEHHITQHKKSSKQQTNDFKPTNHVVTITKTPKARKPEHNTKKSLNQLSKKGKQIIYITAQKVNHWKPSYSINNINKTITKEYLTGKVNINQLHDALIPALCADSKGKVKSFVGFLCYESTLPKDTLKAQSNIDNMLPKLRNYLENTSGSGEADFNF